MMDKEIHFSDDLERTIAELLTENKIEFTHESEDKDQDLDFYLPQFDIYIEVKQFHADRINKQLSSKDNVIVVQGRKSLHFLERILRLSAIRKEGDS